MEKTILNDGINKRKIYVAPSILSADFCKMGEEVRRMEDCGADIIHCDVMDGEFVPNITFGSKMVKDIRKCTELPLDVHLMIVKPERYVDQFICAGADYVTVHVEAAERLKETLLGIREKGVKCGMVLSPDTPCEPYLDMAPYCDMILVMSVYPGFGGQKFISGALHKVKAFRAEIDRLGLDIRLEIDGGVGTDNAEEIVSAGADVLVAGSAIFGSSDPEKTMRQLRLEGKRL